MTTIQKSILSAPPALPLSPTALYLVKPPITALSALSARLTTPPLPLPTVERVLVSPSFWQSLSHSLAIALDGRPPLLKGSYLDAASGVKGEIAERESRSVEKGGGEWTHFLDGSKLDNSELKAKGESLMRMLGMEEVQARWPWLPVRTKEILLEYIFSDGALINFAATVGIAPAPTLVHLMDPSLGLFNEESTIDDFKISNRAFEIGLSSHKENIRWNGYDKKVRAQFKMTLEMMKWQKSKDRARRLRWLRQNVATGYMGLMRWNLVRKREELPSFAFKEKERVKVKFPEKKVKKSEEQLEKERQILIQAKNPFVSPEDGETGPSGLRTVDGKGPIVSTQALPLPKIDLQQKRQISTISSKLTTPAHRRQYSTSASTEGTQDLDEVAEPELIQDEDPTPRSGRRRIRRHIPPPKAKLSHTIRHLIPHSRLNPVQFRVAPPEPNSYGQEVTDVVKALVGAIWEEQGLEAARKFLRDNFFSRNIDPTPLLKFDHPRRVLTNTLRKYGRKPPLPRLLRETGRYSKSPVFVVGAYSGSLKLGEGVGQSLSMAATRAFEDALIRIYLTPSREAPVKGKYHEWANGTSRYSDMLIPGKDKVYKAPTIGDSDVILESSSKKYKR